MKRLLILSLLAIFVVGSSLAQQKYVPLAENLKNRTEFQDMKFGVFIHWGIYSMMADGEWIMNNKNINWQEYAKLADGFYPSKYDAAKWVADVKAAGANTFASRRGITTVFRCSIPSNRLIILSTALLLNAIS